jgi:hypothetical protein
MESDRIRLPGQLPEDSLAEGLKRRMRRITNRYTWRRMLLLGALLLWLMRAYGESASAFSAQSYVAVCRLAAIGCWTASGWILDLPRLLFPAVEAFQHLRRPAPRA